MAKVDQDMFLDGLQRVVLPYRPDRAEWVGVVEGLLLKNHGLRAGRRTVLVAAWERFSSEQCAGWLGGDDETVAQFVEWIISKAIP